MPTGTELIAQIRDSLDEPVAAQWTDVMLRRWINEANRDLARVTRHFKSTDTIATVAGQAEYTLDPNIIAVEQAWYDDGTRQLPLAPRHIESMDRIWGDRQDMQGAFPAYFTTMGYAPNHEIRLFPVPAYSDHTIKLVTSIVPTEMATDGTDDATAVDTPPAWYDLLRDYVCFKGLQRDRDQRWVEYRQLYVENRDLLLTRGDYSTVNREVVADPDLGYLPRWLVEPEGW